MISVWSFSMLFSYRSFKWGMWLSLRRLGGTTYWMALGLGSSPMAATMPRGWIQSLLISPWTLWRFRALGLQGRGRDSEASEASTSWMVQPNYMHSLSKVQNFAKSQDGFQTKAPATSFLKLSQPHPRWPCDVHTAPTSKLSSERGPFWALWEISVQATRALSPVSLRKIYHCIKFLHL